MQISLFDETKRLERLDKCGDVLKQLDEVNRKAFRPVLDKTIPREKSPKGGCPL